MKTYQDILSDSLADLDSGSGADNMKRKGIGEALVALTMVLGDMDGKLNRIIGSVNGVGGNLDDLNKNISNFNKASSRLQWWLIFWTAIMAVATLVALFK
ncbi:MAG TPA: hypothetical protein DEA43_00485 [Candidatus Moranbacteria bacterium]|nr:hypothetical protein [Candidatus Moranbacteria bacterium]HBT45349.1 hypothetical protein [Candidatus Moranbacteria bacterium]